MAEAINIDQWQRIAGHLHDYSKMVAETEKARANGEYQDNSPYHRQAGNIRVEAKKVEMDKAVPFIRLRNMSRAAQDLLSYALIEAGVASRKNSPSAAARDFLQEIGNQRFMDDDTDFVVKHEEAQTRLDAIEKTVREMAELSRAEPERAYEQTKAGKNKELAVQRAQQLETIQSRMATNMQGLFSDSENPQRDMGRFVAGLVEKLGIRHAVNEALREQDGPAASRVTAG